MRAKDRRGKLRRLRDVRRPRARKRRVNQVESPAGQERFELSHPVNMEAQIAWKLARKIAGYVRELNDPGVHPERRELLIRQMRAYNLTMARELRDAPFGQPDFTLRRNCLIDLLDVVYDQNFGPNGRWPSERKAQLTASELRHITFVFRASYKQIDPDLVPKLIEHDDLLAKAIVACGNDGGDQKVLVKETKNATLEELFDAIGLRKKPKESAESWRRTLRKKRPTNGSDV